MARPRLKVKRADNLSHGDIIIFDGKKVTVKRVYFQVGRTGTIEYTQQKGITKSFNCEAFEEFRIHKK